jgi:hypothetical protein
VTAAVGSYVSECGISKGGGLSAHALRDSFPLCAPDGYSVSLLLLLLSSMYKSVHKQTVSYVDLKI